MAVLFEVIFLTVVFAFVSENYEKNKSIGIFSSLTMLVYALFIGLRSGYNDTAAYIRSFNNADTLIDFLNNKERMHILHNPLFYGLEALVSDLTDNYHVFFLVVAVVDSVLLFRFLKRYCEGYYAFTILLFWGYGLGVFGLAAMKQITAIALLTLAFDAMVEHKWVIFVVIVLIAGLIHTYAFLFLVMPLFVSKPWDWKTILLIVLTGVIILTFNTSISSILEYADSVGKSVADFEVFDGVQMNIFRVLVFAIVPMGLLIFKSWLIPYMTEVQYILGNMSIIALMFMVMGMVNGANMFGRLATYFVLGDICLLGWIIHHVFEKKSSLLVSIMTIFLFLIFIAYDNVDFSTTAGYSGITIMEFILSL